MLLAFSPSSTPSAQLSSRRPRSLITLQTYPVIHQKRRRDERRDHPTSKQELRDSTKRRKRAFDDLYEALAVYKAEHSHINVPSRYVKDPALRQWVKCTRRSRGTKLIPEQKAKLDQLGFDWETKQEKESKRWNAMLEKLKKYRRFHLDCCIPKDWPSDPQLATWVNYQRGKEANNNLLPHHKQQLDAIQVQWRQRTKMINDTSAVDEKWFQKYQMLVTYREEHGDCVVADKGKEAPDHTLANWVRKQRQAYRHGKLTEERKKWLEELGFVYKVDRANPQDIRNQSIRKKRSST